MTRHAFFSQILVVAFATLSGGLKLRRCRTSGSDEQVIYHTASDPDSSRRTVSGARMVGSDTIDMGTLTLTRQVSSNEWVARLPAGLWRFQIRRDSLTATLTVPDGIIMRGVSASPLRDQQ